MLILLYQTDTNKTECNQQNQICLNPFNILEKEACRLTDGQEPLPHHVGTLHVKQARRSGHMSKMSKAVFSVLKQVQKLYGQRRFNAE
jgi:hypothetical protein